MGLADGELLDGRMQAGHQLFGRFAAVDREKLFQPPIAKESIVLVASLSDAVSVQDQSFAGSEAAGVGIVRESVHDSDDRSAFF